MIGKDHKLKLPVNKSSHCWDKDWLEDLEKTMVKHSENNPQAKTFKQMVDNFTKTLKNLKKPEYSPEQYDETLKDLQKTKENIEIMGKNLDDKSKDLQSFLKKHGLSPDSDIDALSKQQKSLWEMIKANKAMGIKFDAKDFETHDTIIPKAMSDIKKLKEYKSKISDIKKKYEAQEGSFCKEIKSITGFVNTLIKSLSTYKKQSIDQKSNRSQEIQKIIKYMQDDIKSLKK